MTQQPTQRIALVIDSWDYPFNGTVVSTRRFVAALKHSGMEFRILAVGDADDKEGHDRVTFKRLSIPGVNGLLDAMRVPLARPDRAILREALSDCDILHVQYPLFLGYAAMREAQALGIPVVCSFHLQPENILFNLRLSGRWLTDLIYRVFCHYFYRRADRVVAPSEFAANILKSYGVKQPIDVLSNGVLSSFLDVRREPRSPESPFRLLCVGRLAKEKQQETLLRAVAGSRHRAEIALTLVGTGPEESALKKTAQSLGLDVQIGPVSDDALLELYSRADLFVHAGAIELEGMSVLEAMATGNCVVVSDSAASASADLVSHEMAKFTTGDHEDLAQKIDFWLDSPLPREASGEANHRYAKGLSHDRSAAQLAALYDQLAIDSTVEGAPDQRMNGTDLF